MRLPDEVNSAAAETAPSISADGTELYFRRSNTPFEGPGERGDIYVSRRNSVSEPWGIAAKVPDPISTDDFDENEPFISVDGLELLFNTSRPDDAGQAVWISRRQSTDEAFAAAEIFVFPGTGASGAGGGSPFIADDGLSFFFVNPELGGLGQDDFYMATRDSLSDDFGAAIHLASISSPQEDFGLILSPDGTMVYFSSDRPGAPSGGNLGQYAIWQATVIPEPSSLGMMCLGLVGLSAFRRAVFRTMVVA
jgi:hypothetical protein